MTFIQTFRTSSILLYCVHMFIVLTGTTLGLHYLGFAHLIVPVTLGAIATALTDFDDRLSIRLRNLFYVCVLFFSVSSILEFLYPYKLLFILYLSLSSGALMLLGALGQRYATISFGTVLLSIYTMFGLGEYSAWYLQPCYFVLGALWYGLISIVFYLLKPTQAVQDNLAQCFEHMAELLTLKSRLFDPDNNTQKNTQNNKQNKIHNQDLEQNQASDSDHVEKILYELSLKNSQVVNSLNLCKAALISRLRASRANQKIIYWLNLYFFAQDMHEQATSNYLHYENIHRNFNRTDLIYRFQKNILLQAQNCQHLADSVLSLKPFQLNTQNTHALDQLKYSLDDWIELNPHNLEVKNLSLVFNNLYNVQQQFINISIEQNHYQPNYDTSSNPRQDNLNLLDDDIHGIQDLWLKLKQHLSPKSALFRHAVRIAFVFAVGYGISLLPFAKNGYWILLTSLFVCQISYFATKSRLKMRTLGTILGVILGIPILYFVPSVEGQLVLTIIFGVYFFYLRSKKYAIATLMATLMVLLIFNLKGAGYAIILPRIIDTLIGCALAWFAVSFIWPDWNFRNISNTIKKSTTATLNYFDAIVAQYQFGKNNGTAYRAARRYAHNAQIELSSMISSLSTEPNPNQSLIHTAFRYLVYSHSQLSYVSALGSHRELVSDHQVLDLMLWCKQTLEGVLIHQHTLYLETINEKLNEIQQLSLHENLSSNLLLALKQISLLLETLPELIKLRNTLLLLEIK